MSSNQQITDKTYCVMLADNYKTYLNKNEAEFLSKAFEQGKEVVRVGEKTFFKFGVRFILPASEIGREDRIKRGDWKCEYDYWHRRGEECGHAEMARYDKK
jgi:hypothetical protein